jgi:hypothetical protein
MQRTGIEGIFEVQRVRHGAIGKGTRESVRGFLESKNAAARPALVAAGQLNERQNIGAATAGSEHDADAIQNGTLGGMNGRRR